MAASALRGWSLLVSSLPQWRLDGAFCSSALNSLSSHLHSNDVAQRDAAGEGAALLFSMADLPNADANGYDSAGASLSLVLARFPFRLSFKCLSFGGNIGAYSQI